MIKAIGALFLSKNTNTILMNLRSSTVSYPLHWAFFGGKIEKNETIIEGLKREIREETGFLIGRESIFPLDVFTTSDSSFEYYTVVIVVEDEFIPKINRETEGYAWIKLGSWPSPLHPGVIGLSKSNIVDSLEWCRDRTIKDQSYLPKQA